MDKYYAEVIGDPVDHSKSPLIHRFWLDSLGIDGEYRAMRVPTEQLGAYIAQRRRDPEWCGCNVTLPHKQAIIPFLDRLSPRAAEVGAVNLVLPNETLIGANTDVDGITGSLPMFEQGQLREVCLIGSGGAALAALFAFRLMGVPRVTLNVRDRAKGEALLADWGFEGRVGAVDDRNNLFDAQLIINATTLGMHGQVAMPDSLLQHVRTHPDDDAVVFDMVYAPLETALLLAARDRGLCTVDGLAMLIGQAAAAFYALFNVPAPRERDASLRALLTA